MMIVCVVNVTIGTRRDICMGLEYFEEHARTGPLSLQQ